MEKPFLRIRMHGYIKEMSEPSLIEAPWATWGDSKGAGGSFLDFLEQECIGSIMLIMRMVIFRC
jgi:hypothetical protein